MTTRFALILALIPALFLPSLCTAQNAEADSLRALVSERTTEDTNRVNTLLALAWTLRVEAPEEAIERSNEAYELSTKIDFPRGKATAQSTIGVIEYRRGNLPDALEAHLQALQLREQIGDQNGVGKSYINLGNIYTDMGNLQEAMKYYSKALEIFEAGGDEERTAMACLNIGGLYLAMDDNDRAREYCNRTAAIARSIGDPLLEAQAKNNAGICYQNLNQYDSAMLCYKSSYDLAESEGEYTMMIDAGMNVGTVYRLKGESSSAMQWHNDMILMSRKMGYMEGLRELYLLLSDDYKATGDYKNAYLNYVLYKQYNDSIYNESNARQLLELQQKFEMQQKEMEISKLETQLKSEQSDAQGATPWIVGGVIGFFVLLGVTIPIIILASNRKRDRMIIEAQQQQINRMYPGGQRNYPGQM